MTPLTPLDPSLGIAEEYCIFGSRSERGPSDLYVFRSSKDDLLYVDIASFRTDPPRPFHPSLEKYAGTERTFDNATEALRYVKRLHSYGFNIPWSLVERLDDESHAEGRAHEQCCSRHRHHVIPHTNCILR